MTFQLLGPQVYKCGCVLPTCQPYVFWWPPLDVSSRGRVDTQVPCPGEGVPYHVTYPMMYLMLPTPFPL